MTDTAPSSETLWTYRFSQPDETELETSKLNGDAAAEAKARELSKSKETPVVVHRHSAHVDAWEYVTEVDERTTL